MEHLDVLIVGAGLSGVCAAHSVVTDCPWASFAMVEARDSMGGTWDLFRYPGIRSDSDMYTLGFSFRPWTETRGIVDGPSILQYLKDTAREDGTDRKIRYGHRVVAAAWSSDDARWTVTIERTVDGVAETVQLTCGFLITCAGYYRYDRGHMPEFDGIGDFDGQVIHPQFWPDDLDVAGKRIVVIGSGATAVTLVPALAGTAEHVTMLQRSPTYMAAIPERDPLASLLGRVLPERFRHRANRAAHARFSELTYRFSRSRPDVMKKVLRKGVERQLPAGFDIDRHFTPRYNPWDERLCAVLDGDLFTAIRQGTASIVTDTIDRFVPDGIRLSSGQVLPADIVVTATGLELLFIGGMDLTVDGADVPVAQRLVYKGHMLEGVPNCGFVMGYTNASWTLKAELSCRYIAAVLNHMRRTGSVSCVPRAPDYQRTHESLLGLTSGYIRRADNLLPRQGRTFPWRVMQSYRDDSKALAIDNIDDGALAFQTTR